MAPLVNGHTHAAMTLFRGTGGDLPLMPWLEERIWPVEAKLDAEDVYWGTRLACAEMIRTGTTRFWDMYWQPGATARAVADAGIRATIGAPLFDADGDTERLRELRAARASSELGRAEPARSPPRSPRTRSTRSARSRCAGSPSSAPSAGCRPDPPLRDRAGGRGLHRRPRRAARPPTSTGLGLLNERTVLAHGVWLDPEELALIAARGATVVANPVANMKLAVGGVFPYPAARAAGVAVGLGTDGAGSNDSLDLLADLKFFALAQKHAAGDPTAIDAAEAWAVATGARAPLLGAAPLRAGAPADFLLLRADSPELGIGDLTAGLVYAASGARSSTPPSSPAGC